MLKITEIRCPLGQTLDKGKIAEKLHCAPSQILSYTIEREALDAREGICHTYTVYAEVKQEERYLRRRGVSLGSRLLSCDPLLHNALDHFLRRFLGDFGSIRNPVSCNRGTLGNALSSARSFVSRSSGFVCGIFDSGFRLLDRLFGSLGSFFDFAFELCGNRLFSRLLLVGLLFLFLLLARIHPLAQAADGVAERLAQLRKVLGPEDDKDDQQDDDELKAAHSENFHGSSSVSDACFLSMRVYAISPALQVNIPQEHHTYA